jgi:hypothetical protein
MIIGPARAEEAGDVVIPPPPHRGEGLRSRIFPSEGVLHEAIEVYGQPDPGGAAAGGGRDNGTGPVPGTWDQSGDVPQVA